MNRDAAVVPLTGAMNCRDIGGYPATQDRRVRTNAIFRSDRLSQLTDDDQEELAGYGIRTVIDFRTSAEASRDVSRLWSTVTTHAPLPIGDEIAQQQEFVDRIRSGEITSVTVDDVVDSYFARHKVKPGVTGWAQVNGWRGEVDTEEKIHGRVDYDLYYIENWSIGLDFKILWLTIARGVFHIHAF